MIEDEELRITFKIASEEHLQKLEEGLLHLEKNPNDIEKLDEMTREAHSLKGDANMLGVKDVGTLAHQIEHILVTVKRGEEKITSELCDRICSGLDAIRALVREAVTGTSSGVNTFYVLAHLMGAEPKIKTPPLIEIAESLNEISPSSTALFIFNQQQQPQPEQETAPEPQKESTAIEAAADKNIDSPFLKNIVSSRNQVSGDAPPPYQKSHRYIEEEELRETFKIACEEHLQKLDEGLLYLEKNPEDHTKIEELLREAHSIKGDAGMLGVRDIGTLAHQLENILNAIKRGEIAISPALCDRLSGGLHALRELVSEAVTGNISNINLPQIQASLAEVEQKTPHPENDTPPSSDLPHKSDKEEPLLPPLRQKTLPEEHQNFNQPTPEPIHQNQIADISTTTPTSQNGKKQQSATSSSERYRIDTIRVETRNLDSLMTQTGELTVTKIRIAHRLAEIEEIVNLWEEWSRDIFINRFAIEELGKGERNGKIEQIHKIYHRTEERLEQLGTHLNRLRAAVYEDIARLEVITDELEEGIRTLRLLPLSTIFSLFPRMVRDLARKEGKQVELIIEGGETRADKRILEEMKDPLMHILRNAIDHGIETPAERQQLGKPLPAIIRLRGYQTATNIVIEVSDDGRGLDIESIKRTAIKRGMYREEELAAMTTQQIQSLIFAPGFSTRTFVTEVSGRGVGLDVVRTNVERLKGSIQVESTPGRGCTLRLQLSTTLATAHVLLVSCNGITYALPVEFVQIARLVPQSDIFTIEGRETIVLDAQPVSVARLGDLLQTTPNGERLPDSSVPLPCIIIKVGEERLGLIVDALLDEQDVVLKPQSKLLKRVRNIAGATILGTGEVCMVLNPQDLIKSVRSSAKTALPAQQIEQARKKPVILLVEDSLTTRTLEKRILEGAGYEVVTAVDGLDAYNKLRTRSFDAVVSDIQMPNLDGLELTAKIRQHKEYKELPVILVTSLATDEDKRRGAEVGANAYITKSTFNQEVLLETLRRLV
ncbi:MAG TPA: Hpt domain-containing protein [Oscillatoriaceae cyanobacterium M7585_C2015_266]|nr:Hpt domain-containing protein [Oscillatoriaceae cyanobacterium M7585_C2015_266]